MSDCKSIASYSILIIFINLASSENIRILELVMTLRRSLIKILKRRVDKWSPWGTPEGTGKRVDLKLRGLTIWNRSQRKDWNQLRRDPEKPNDCSFLIRIKWLTWSKALEKSA